AAAGIEFESKKRSSTFSGASPLSQQRNSMHLLFNDTSAESSALNPIRYTIGTSSLGGILVASSKLGICAVLLGDAPNGLAGQLRRMFPQSRLQKDDEALRHSLQSVARLADEPASLVDLPIDMHGTPFQKKVWE